MPAFVANTNVLMLTGLHNAATDAYISNATVEVTIKDLAGVAVPGVTWPISMAYVTASDGDYMGVLIDGINFDHNTRYIAYVDANAGPDLIGHWEFKFKAQTRKSVEA